MVDSTHEFLRYSVPGYLFAATLIGLITFMGGSWFLKGDWTRATLVLISGPTTGVVIFSVYYWIFDWAAYSTKPMIGMRYLRELKKRVEELMKNKGLSPTEIKENLTDAYLKDVYDRVFFSKDVPDAIRDRMLFLWSRVHSAWASTLAIGIGLVLAWVMDLLWWDLRIDYPRHLWSAFSIICVILGCMFWFGYRMKHQAEILEEFFFQEHISKHSFSKQIDLTIEFLDALHNRPERADASQQENTGISELVTSKPKS